MENRKTEQFKHTGYQNIETVDLNVDTGIQHPFSMWVK